MKIFKLTLRKKFILYGLPLTLCVFALGAYCLWTFANIHKHFEKLQKDITPNALAMLEVKELLLSLEAGIKEKQVDRQKILQYISQLKKDVAAHPNHSATVLGNSAKTTHDMVHHTIKTMSLSEYILKQSETGWQGEELAEVAGIISQEIKALGPFVDEHLKIHLEELTKTEAFVSKKYKQTLAVVSMAGIAVIAFTALMLIAMMRSVLGPVRILAEGTKQIGDGKLTKHLAIKTGDEFEFLAQEFNKMAGKLAEYHDSLEQKVQERTKELIAANDELKKAEDYAHSLSQELLKVQENERQQISLDLHDNVAQELSSLKVSGKLIHADIERGKLPGLEELSEWENMLDRCIKTVRDLSYNIRPPGLEHLGLASTLSDYCRNFSMNTGIEVKFSQVGADNLQLEFNYAINLFRLVQESLNNIKSHAQASRALVKLLVSHPHVILRIEDDGHGFELDQGLKKARKEQRFGLLGMQERVRMINGTIKISSNEQEGTKILIQAPVTLTGAGSI